MSTTNGTRCLERIQDSPRVITAALTTRRAVVNFLLEYQPETIWLVGSGWEGSFSLEDTVCAGAIIHELMDQAHLTLKDVAQNDETVAAVALFLQWRDQLPELMRYASHGQRLLRLHNLEDLDYCAQLDILDIVPIQQEKGVLVKH
jgi:2-phosphosulfolactate phosphatase